MRTRFKLSRAFINLRRDVICIISLLASTPKQLKNGQERLRGTHYCNVNFAAFPGLAHVCIFRSEMLQSQERSSRFTKTKMVSANDQN